MKIRFQSAVYLLLCAEASVRHGQLEDALALVLESRSMAQLTGERTVNHRLEQVAGQILREVQGRPYDPYSVRLSPDPPIRLAEYGRKWIAP